VLRPRVQEFAVEKLQLLLEQVATDEDGANVEWTEDLMKNCLLLYYALSHLDPTLLEGLAQVL